jgi:hypothetical protein
MLSGSTIHWLIVALLGEYAAIASVDLQRQTNSLDPFVRLVATSNLVRTDAPLAKAKPGHRYKWRTIDQRYRMSTHMGHAIGLADGSLLNLGSLLVNRYDPEVWVEEDSELPIEV